MAKNRYLKALFKTVLCCAFFHLTLLGILFLMTLKTTYINLFTIVGLAEFFPGIDIGIVSLLISMAVALSIYFFFYFKSK